MCVLLTYGASQLYKILSFARQFFTVIYISVKIKTYVGVHVKCPMLH